MLIPSTPGPARCAGRVGAVAAITIAVVLTGAAAPAAAELTGSAAPAGHHPTTGTVGPDTTTAEPDPTTTGWPETTTVGPDAAVVVRARATVTVTGRAWEDRDRDGVQDTGEPGIPGLPVALISGDLVAVGPDSTEASPDAATQRRHLRAALGGHRASGVSAAREATVRETTTGADGGYGFPGVPTGTLMVALRAGPLNGSGEIPVAVWTFSPRGAGTDTTRDSDFAPFEFPGQPTIAGFSDQLVAAAGTPVDLDAGLYRGGGTLPVTGRRAWVTLSTGAVSVVIGLTLVRVGGRRRLT